MKKIIHKLKKNRLVSKIAALFMICMILVSSFTVSSFAADDEYIIKAGSYQSVDRQAVWLPDEVLRIDGNFSSFGVSFTGIEFTLDDIILYPIDASLLYEWTDLSMTFVIEVEEDISVNFLQYNVFTKNFIYQGSPTESITDVWTSITGSIVSLLGSAQNVFITQSISGESSGSFVLPQRSSSLGDWAYLDIPFSDHSLIEVGSSFTSFYSSGNVSMDFVFEDIEYGGVSYLGSTSKYGSYTSTIVIDKESNTLSLFTDLPSDLSGETIEYGVFEYESHLSFLGTLVVLGLALGLILLLVYVILNFLRLRG